MSRDSSTTYIHLPATSSRYADLFEEFCRPPSTSISNTTTSNGALTGTAQHASSATNPSSAPGPLNDGSGMTTLPGSFLPFEEIHLPPHLMPLNPEDEDGVVPDMHAAFGINRALGQSGQAGSQGGSGASLAAAGGVLGGGGAGAGGPGEASMAGVQREPVWRDLGLGLLVDEAGWEGRRKAKSGGLGMRREGKRQGLLFLR